MDTADAANTGKTGYELKQAFLSSAIADISTYIQLADTKVSIIMAAVVALLVGLFACWQPIGARIAVIRPCSWRGAAFLVLAVLLAASMVGVFVCGILTIRNHRSRLAYPSRWFLPQSTQAYSFDAYRQDVLSMSDEEIIVNMAAELYKLNDINRQKQAAGKWTLRFFSASLVLLAAAALLLV